MDPNRYERFLKAHFRSVYAWCEQQYGEEPVAALAAQRIVLDSYEQQILQLAESNLDLAREAFNAGETDLTALLDADFCELGSLLDHLIGGAGDQRSFDVGGCLEHA